MATPQSNNFDPASIGAVPINQPQAQGNFDPASIGATPIQGNYDQGMGIIKGATNFLFPIVSDVYHDIKGDNSKTFLQQAGDTVLSALPFIPGLGEVGEAARAGEAGVEAGTTGANLWSKFTQLPTVVKGAAVGYGAGVASNLSQGEGIGQSFVPNVNTVAGTITGGVAPSLIKGASVAMDAIRGIDPQVATELSRMGVEANPDDIALMQKYNQAAKSHATDVRTPSVENVAADNLDQAAEKIAQKTRTAGQEVGQAKLANGKVPLGDASNVATDFANEVKQRYGLEITSDPNGHVNVTPTDRLRQIPPADVSRIQTLAQQLNQLGTGARAGDAVDVIANIDDDLNYSKSAYGKSVSPIDQLFGETREDLNKVLRSSAPTLADANDRFSQLKTLQGTIAETAGNKLQRGELLMQRMFSNKSQDSLELFDAIKDETGIDLTKHAVLAKNAIDNYGSKADKSLLEQMIMGAAKGKGRALDMALSAGQAGLRKIFTPEGKALSLIKGGNPLFDFLIDQGKPLLTKSAIELSRKTGSN